MTIRRFLFLLRGIDKGWRLYPYGGKPRPRLIRTMTRKGDLRCPIEAVADHCGVKPEHFLPSQRVRYSSAGLLGTAMGLSLTDVSRIIRAADGDGLGTWLLRRRLLRATGVKGRKG